VVTNWSWTNGIYKVYLRYIWQGYHQVYGHIRCIYTVPANLMNEFMNSSPLQPTFSNRDSRLGAPAPLWPSVSTTSCWTSVWTPAQYNPPWATETWGWARLPPSGRLSTPPLAWWPWSVRPTPYGQPTTNEKTTRQAELYLVTQSMKQGKMKRVCTPYCQLTTNEKNTRQAKL
jgi:hypothetical protein